MCFSSEASFAAAAVLSVTGVIAIKKANGTPRIAFAIIPLLFAVQQLTEGLFWLTQDGSLSRTWETPSVLVFLIFAQVIWPFWVPFSIFRMEENPARRKLLGYLVASGSLFSAYTIYALLSFPIHGYVAEHHIAYKIDVPEGPMIYARMMFYLVATLFPPFLSGRRRMPLLAIALLLSFLASWLFFPDYIISTWCYFAAAISIIVVYILYSQKDAESKRRALFHQ